MTPIAQSGSQICCRTFRPECRTIYWRLQCVSFAHQIKCANAKSTSGLVLLVRPGPNFLSMEGRDGYRSRCAEGIV